MMSHPYRRSVAMRTSRSWTFPKRPAFLLFLWLRNTPRTSEFLSTGDQETAFSSDLLVPETHRQLLHFAQSVFRLTIAARGDKPSFDLPSNTTYKKVDFKKNYDDIKPVSFEPKNQVY